MIEKRKYICSKKARQSAKGEECTMNSPECNYNPETTVLCHSNSQKHGKGTSIKASDEWTFYGCSGCNYWFDSIPADPLVKEMYFERAHKRTQKRFKEKGLWEVLID